MQIIATKKPIHNEPYDISAIERWRPNNDEHLQQVFRFLFIFVGGSVLTSIICGRLNS